MNTYLKKFFDIILNIPFSVLRLVNGKKLDSSWRNVCIISLHNLGDTIFTLPTINYFYKNFNCSIVCNSNSKVIYLEQFPNANYIVCDFPVLDRPIRFVARRIRKEIRSLPEHLIVDITGNILSASCYFGIRLQSIIGISERPFCYLFNNYHLKRTSPTLFSLYFDAIKVTDAKASIQDYLITPKIDLPEDYILIHPFAGWKEKEWGLKRFIELAEQLSELAPVKVIVKKGDFKDDVREYLLRNNLTFHESNSIEDLIKQIKACSIFIGNDSGALHIAEYYEKKVIGIYGPSNYLYSMMMNKNSVVVKNDMNCSPPHNQQLCFTDGGRNGCPSNECMKSITTQQVKSQIQKLLIPQEI